MILYLDASALVKQYVRERGSDEVALALARAQTVGTAAISRAEISAALARAVRMGVLTADAGAAALQAFHSDWPALVRVPVTEALIARADGLAWDYHLRGYDAVHLAAAVAWGEDMGSPLALVTFDRELWLAAQRLGLTPCPEDLPSRLEQWKSKTP